MAEREDIERLLRDLHAARVGGQLERLCATFAPDATFRIAGHSDGKAITVAVRGIADIRPWLAMLLKSFRLENYQLLSQVIDGRRAALHWQVDIHSRITGAVVATELVDLVEVRDGLASSYTEFFAPRQ